jgi:hypothetical protein
MTDEYIAKITAYGKYLRKMSAGPFSALGLHPEIPVPQGQKAIHQMQ